MGGFFPGMVSPPTRVGDGKRFYAPAGFLVCLRFLDSFFLPLPQDQKADSRGEPGGDIDIDDAFHGMLSGKQQKDAQDAEKADG